MDAVLNSLANGVPELAKYLLVVTIIYVIGVIIYVKLSPQKELELIQKGNMAAAVTFSALLICLALPLIACLVYRLNVLDVAVWGTFSLFLQLFLFRLTDLLFKGMPTRIENDEVAPALVLAAIKLVGSLALAFALLP